MKGQLFIDSLRVIISNFEALTLKLVNRNSPLSYKIQDLSLNLLAFKTALLTNLCTLLREGANTIVCRKLQQQEQESKQKLKKLQLHAFLRKKIIRLQKQSMMSSIGSESFSSQFVEDQTVSKLKNSMILIEKDLGINDQLDKQEEQVSQIVSRSMASLEMTPIKNNRINVTEGSGGDTSMRIQDQYVLTENQDKNIQTLAGVELRKQPETQKKGNPPKAPNKKKKTTVYSSKGGMLDNLLEESLQSYIQGPMKSNHKNQKFED